jgi:hypothetical protein
MSAEARGWLAAAAPIGLWMVHLTASAAVVPPVCQRGLGWLPHLLTVALTLACVPFLMIAGGLARNRDDDDLRFLGSLGLGLGAASVVLIVVEGAMAGAIPPCR